MKKLLEFLALRSTDGDLGVEIEIEGQDLPAVYEEGWKTEVDNSLRGGQEYIFAGPCNLDGVRPRLEYLHKRFQESGAKAKFSFRTSVHVHMNVQQLTYNQLLNVIYTYLLIEEPLMNLCGEERKGNRFCLRMADAEGMIDTLAKLFSGTEHYLKKQIPTNKMRYAAINVEALGKYGSLEFRAMKGNMDIDKIVMWCTTLLNIREFASKYDNPKDIYNLYIKKEAANFFKLAVKDCAKNFEYPELVHDIQRNFSLSIDLPFSFAKRKEQAEAPKADTLEEFVARHGELRDAVRKPARIADFPRADAYKRIILTAGQLRSCRDKATRSLAEHQAARARLDIRLLNEIEQMEYLDKSKALIADDLRKKLWKERQNDVVGVQLDVVGARVGAMWIDEIIEPI